MSTRLVKVPENDRHMPNCQPSKETSEANRLDQERMHQTLKDAIKVFDPKSYENGK